MLYGDLREPLIKLGYLPIPVIPRDKRPATKNWVSCPAPEGYDNYSIGILCGQGEYPLAGIDLDIYDRDFSSFMSDHILNKYGETVSRVGKEPKNLLVYRMDCANTPKRISNKYVKQQGDIIKHGVEILGYGSQFVAYGIHQSTKKPYSWPSILGSLHDLPASSLPVITKDDIEYIISFFHKHSAARGYQVSKDDEESQSKSTDDYDPNDPLDIIEPVGKTINEVKEMLKSLDPGMGRAKWIRIGMALFHEFSGSPEALELWEDWSIQGKNYKEGDTEKQWASFNNYDGRPITLRSLIKAFNDAQPIPQPPPELHSDHPRWSAASLSGEKYIMTLPPPLIWIAEGFLPLGVPGIVSGEGGSSFKSTLMLDLCISIALSNIIKTPWLGRYKLNTYKVLYISLEDDCEVIHRRIHAIFEKKTMTEPDMIPIYDAFRNNFMVLTREIFFEENHEILINPHGHRTNKYNKLSATIAALGVGLVIIDTRSKAFSVDENDNTLNSKLMTEITSLTKTQINGFQPNKATVLMISHVSKAVRSGLETNGNNSVRGAGSLGDDSRWNLWIRPLGVRDKEDRPLIELNHAKNSNADPRKALIVAVKWPEFIPTEETKEGLLERKKEERTSKIEGEIADLLNEKGELCASDIEEELGVRKDLRLAAMKNLKKNDIIGIKREGTRLKYFMKHMVPGTVWEP